MFLPALLNALPGDPDWEFFLPDDDEIYPDPGDFWIEPDEDDS